MEKQNQREAIKIGGGVVRGYIIVLLSALLLYIATCAPGSVWQDSGMIQYRVWHNDIMGSRGLAMSHPLFYIIAIGAKYIPIGQFGYRVNLVSALAGAVAVANLFLLLRLWLGSMFSALIGAVSLALSHTFWRHATIPETYNLYTVFLLLELVAVVLYSKTKSPKYLYLLGLFNGLAIADHMLGVIGLACYGTFLVVLLVKREIRLRQLGIIILFWIAGAMPFEYLIIKNIAQTGDLGGTLSSAIFADKYRTLVLNTTISAKIVKENIMWILLNFPTPNVLLFFIGAYSLHRLSPNRAFANIVRILTLLFFVFAFRYTIVDRYAFFIPFYCLVSLLIGAGFEMFVRRPNRKIIAYLVVVCTLLPIPVYLTVPKIAGKLGIQGRPRQIPYRDEYKYFLQPWRTGCDGPKRFANEVLSIVEPNSIILADSTTVFPLLYEQEVKNKRPDVKITAGFVGSKNSPVVNKETIENLLANRNIYVVSLTKGYTPAFVLERYDFVPAGIIWRVVPKQTN